MPRPSKFRMRINSNAFQESSNLLKSVERTSEKPKIDVRPKSSDPRKSLHEPSSHSKSEAVIHLNMDQKSSNTTNPMEAASQSGKADLKQKEEKNIVVPNHNVSP